ncbi:MAG TPA: CDP-alcohol phosphatidyltransferase family protein [Gemmatimonadaceae bacterium]|nr:CDP-alcohol phosphatidyltransferase family protein [Gemmatimonadaceae bacterium]
MSRDAILTLPNAVSLSRLVLASLFLVVPNQPARVAIVAVAGATDMLDGWLARRTRTASRFGAIVDPIADRLFVLAVILAFLLEGALTWGQTLLLLSRDVATTIGFFVARAVSWLRPVELKARLPGKVVTVLQMAVLVAVLLVPAAVHALVLLVAVASVVAIADYTAMLWRGRLR